MSYPKRFMQRWNRRHVCMILRYYFCHWNTFLLQFWMNMYSVLVFFLFFCNLPMGRVWLLCWLWREVDGLLNLNRFRSKALDKRDTDEFVLKRIVWNISGSLGDAFSLICRDFFSVLKQNKMLKIFTRSTLMSPRIHDNGTLKKVYFCPHKSWFMEFKDMFLGQISTEKNLFFCLFFLKI